MIRILKTSSVRASLVRVSAHLPRSVLRGEMLGFQAFFLLHSASARASPVRVGAHLLRSVLRGEMLVFQSVSSAKIVRNAKDWF
jgi:hypothetical protein